MTTQSTQADIAEEQAIVERIYEALVDQRLAPGTKLSEADLCEAFGVGRMRIRRSLLMLASRELVDLLPNRGAYVARPSAKQAQDVFDMRMMIEPSMARMAVSKASVADIDNLADHVAKERQAQAAGQRRAAISLSGEFHIAMARVADNAVLTATVKDLITRSSLIIAMFGDTGVNNNCRDDEHARLLDAMRQKDSALAEKLMQDHIRHIRDHLDLDREPQRSQDIVSLFATR
jgi:DNA-binding GntR family transcriptional regulator